MKVIAVLGKLKTGDTVLLTDNQVQPFVVASGYDATKADGDKWTRGKYCSSLAELAMHITYTELPIGYQRMSEIASKALDGLVEDDKEQAIIYARNEIELSDEEMTYFGLDAYEDEIDS